MKILIQLLMSLSLMALMSCTKSEKESESDAMASAPVKVSCNDYSSCSAGVACAAGMACVSTSQCETAICVGEVKACETFCGSSDCEIAESMPVQITCK